MPFDHVYETLLQSVHEGIYFVDLERKITFWNKGAELITGFSSQQMIGSHCYDNLLNHIDEFGNKICLGVCPLQHTMNDGRSRELILYLHHKDGHRVKISTRTTPILEDGKVVGAVEMFTKVKKDDNNIVDSSGDYSIEELKILAHYDQLTGIPNRRYADTLIDSKIKEFYNLGLPFGVLFLDIDHFRDFNNNFGHAMGDKVLTMVAKSLVNAVRSCDSVCRWGGEEFIVILPSIDIKSLEHIAGKMRILVENSIIRTTDKDENPLELQVTISIGGTIVQPEDNANKVVNRADKLMYMSKENGRNQVTMG